MAHPNSPPPPVFQTGPSDQVPAHLKADLPTLSPEVVTDSYWMRVEPFLPQVALENLSKISQPAVGRGRKPVHPRQILKAIIHVVVNRISWYQLPETTFGLSYGTAAIAFRRWSKDGFFARLHDAGLAPHSEWEGIAWRWHQDGGEWSQLTVDGSESIKPPKSRQRTALPSDLADSETDDQGARNMTFRPAKSRKYGKILHNYSNLQLHQKF